MRNIASAALLLLSLTSCADEQMTLTGTITALPEGCRLALMCYDQDQTLDSVPTYIDIEASENFTLNAALDGPTLLRLVVTRYNQAYGAQAPAAAVSFMADNEKVTLPSVSFNDLAMYSAQDCAEENVVIKGGRAEKGYREYIDSIRPIKAEIAALWKEYGEVIMDARFGLRSEDNDSVKMFSAQMDALQSRIAGKTNEFVSLHPDYAVSALFVSRELNSTYKYTAEEIDSLVAIIADNPDKRRVRIARRNAQKAKAHALGKPLGNEDVTLADGTICHLQDLLGRDGLTLIDCWASWCMPCRRAIPKIKAMAEEYTGRLTVVSISCDRKEDDWRRAMNEEGMPWQQAILSAGQLDPFMTAYDVKFIPRLMLVKDGKILLATSDPEEAARYVKDIVQR